MIPVTSYLTKPSGPIQKLLETGLSFIPSSALTSTSRTSIPALSAFYIFVTFAASGAASAAGQAMSRSESLDNNHPRKYVNNMDGLPLRMRSAHLNLMENFPGFAVAAALAQSLAPGNQQVINLLALHVFLKCLLYYPSYLANIAPPRTLSHVLATASVINVCWRLACGES